MNLLDQHPPRFVVSVDHAVFDWTKGRNIAQCRSQADAANIVCAMNYYHQFVMSALDPLTPQEAAQL